MKMRTARHPNCTRRDNTQKISTTTKIIARCTEIIRRAMLVNVVDQCQNTRAGDLPSTYF